jgi:hypothetical protein
MGKIVPVANLDNGARWDHIASDKEIKEALRMTGQGTSYSVVEVPSIGVTLLMVPVVRTIVRSAAMGGGINNIEGGWVYKNPFSMLLDWEEIKSLETGIRDEHRN